ncbi:MAG: preprotein translocase subunit SecE [Candidatus Levybacteria bacterium]|nr:preprotein translocase subunit SecE [Candidatus Levybacteria bacterium]
MTTTPIDFVKQALDELKKVTWPTKAEIIRLTISVIVISIAVGVFLGGIDFVLTKVMEVVIK